MDSSFINSGFTEKKFYSNDNRYLFKKHSEIVPKEEDLKQFYRHISNVEKALKLVSDEFVENDDLFRKMLNLPEEDKKTRILQGEIRAGLFGKKLLLRDENQIDLILFCSVKPTTQLIRKIMEILRPKLKLIEDLDYELEENLKAAAIDVKPTNDIKIRITLTSLLVKEQSLANGENEIPDPDEMLDKQRMLDSLRALRRFKWYQSKVAPFNPCPMIIRLLRDLVKRNKVWQPITCWTLELICERTMANFLSQPTAAEAFKYILQTLGSGVLLKDNENEILIPDPCENDLIDALGYLTEKERMDITESANTLVQYITFNKIHKVLDTEVINFEHVKKHAGIEESSNKQNVEDKNVSDPSNLVDGEGTTEEK